MRLRSIWILLVKTVSLRLSEGGIRHILRLFFLLLFRIIGIPAEIRLLAGFEGLHDGGRLKDAVLAFGLPVGRELAKAGQDLNEVSESVEILGLLLGDCLNRALFLVYLCEDSQH